MQILLSLIKKNKIIRFLFSGGLGAFSQVFALYIFVDKIGVSYIISTCLAFLFSILVGYIMQKFFTFRDYSKDIKKQFSKFFIVAVTIFSLNLLIMYSLVGMVNIPYLLAQVISSALIAFVSYTIFDRLIFKETV